MNIFESFRIAWTALMSNKVRALLTMLGIIIGVGAVITMLAIGNGLARGFESEFNKLGVGIFYVTPDYGSEDANDQRQPRLTSADVEAITVSGMTPAVATVAVELDGNGVVSAGRDRYMYSVKGITPSYFTIADNTLGAGRYYTADEERDRARVVVIGNEVATTLFGSISGAVGQRV